MTKRLNLTAAVSSIISVAALTGITLSTAALFGGCKTPVPGTGPSQTAIYVGIGIQATVPEAVAVAVSMEPTSVPWLAAASQAVSGMVGSTNYSATALLEALNAIPGSDKPAWQVAKAAVIGGVGLYSGLGQAGVFDATDANYCLAILANSIKAGLPPETVQSVRAKFTAARAKYATMKR